MYSKYNHSDSRPAVADLNNLIGDRVTPIDLFKLARRQWLQGQRISIGALAEELDISRSTAYRWIGLKQFLLEEIIWSLAEPAFKRAIDDTPGQGIDHVVNVHHKFMRNFSSFEPLHKYLKHDPVNALRLLTTSTTSIFERIIQLVADHLNDQAAQGHLTLPAKARELAKIIVLTNQALIYNDVIGGKKPDFARACLICRVVLSADKIPGH